MDKPNSFRYACYLCLFFLPAVSIAQPIQQDDKSIFNVVWENDVFVGEDRDYTNGIRFSWLSSEANAPDWARNIASYLPSNYGRQRLNIALGQNMYVPSDITRSDLIIDDRPYAGWLYGSVGIISNNDKTLDNAMITLGVVGPLAQGEAVQKFVHNLIDTTEPEGWDNQIENEPGIIFTYERKWRNLYEFRPFGVGADITPHLGINLGNIYTDTTVGGTLRLGYDLPSDYGPPRIRPSLPGSDFFIPTKNIGGYLFATLEGRAVGRNIFLDGNTFQSSHHVDKDILVGSLQFGAAITYKNARISYNNVIVTKEFEDERDHPEFGVFTVSYRF